MAIMLLNFATVLAYSFAASMPWLRIQRFGLPSKKAMILFGALAVLGHAYLLHLSIDTQAGQNLSAQNLASLASWLMALLFTVLALVRPFEKLGLVLFPLAASSLVLAFWWPGQHLVATADDIKSLLHILLAVVTFSVLAFAGIQSIILALLDRHLRLKQQFSWLDRLPPLDAMETLLFQTIITGFVLLTLLLWSSFYFYHAAVWPELLSKTLVAVLAWIIFAVLILGHRLLGWRGKKALYCTSLGVSLVLLLYFGLYFTQFDFMS